MTQQFRTWWRSGFYLKMGPALLHVVPVTLSSPFFFVFSKMSQTLLWTNSQSANNPVNIIRTLYHNVMTCPVFSELLNSPVAKSLENQFLKNLYTPFSKCDDYFYIFTGLKDMQKPSTVWSPHVSESVSRTSLYLNKQIKKISSH
jgi:hypothetical protein